MDIILFHTVLYWILHRPTLIMWNSKRNVQYGSNPKCLVKVYSAVLIAPLVQSVSPGIPKALMYTWEEGSGLDILSLTLRQSNPGRRAYTAGSQTCTAPPVGSGMSLLDTPIASDIYLKAWSTNLLLSLLLPMLFSSVYLSGRSDFQYSARSPMIYMARRRLELSGLTNISKLCFVGRSVMMFLMPTSRHHGVLKVRNSFTADEPTWKLY